MEQLFAVGDDYIKALEAARTSEKRKAERVKEGGIANSSGPRKGKPLRETDPW